MSLFPKRTIRGGNVTVHWNLNTSALFSKHIVPQVRIVIKNPVGEENVLFDGYILCLPNIEETSASANNLATDGHKYLRKELPLMILADYLAMGGNKEKFVNILNRMKDGRHFYFNYPVAEDAPLGKYLLVSEMFIEGKLIRSQTEADDFFLIEEIVSLVTYEDEFECHFRVTNNSPEPVPIKVVSYNPNEEVTPQSIEVTIIERLSERDFVRKGGYHFVSYNEEKIIIPVNKHKNKKQILRNQEYLQLPEKKDVGIHIIHRQSEQGFVLKDDVKYIWKNADGLKFADELRKFNPETYDEMIDSGLIKEIDL